MAEASNLRYPAGTLKSAESCAPSLMLVNSVVMPPAVLLLIGKCSFWPIQRVSLLPVLSVDSHLSQDRPLTVSVPTFLQEASWRPAQGSFLKSCRLGMRCIMGFLASAKNSIYICTSGISM